MDEAETVELLIQQLGRRKEKVIEFKSRNKITKCRNCRKKYREEISMDSDIVTCPYCACVKLPLRLRLKHGILFDPSHPAYAHNRNKTTATF